MDREIEALLRKVGEIKGLIPAGGASDEQIKRYFAAQDEAVEEIARALGRVHDEAAGEIECLKDTVRGLKDELGKDGAGMRPKGEREVAHEVGRTLAALWVNNRAALGGMKCCPNVGVENWTNPRDISWVSGKGFVRGKDALGDPVGNMEGNDQYLINPVYSEILLEYAAERSVMMPLVTDIRMTGASKFIDEDEGGAIKMTWNTGYGQQIRSVGVKSPSRLELKAYTLAGFVSWYDEFDEDAFVDLGRRFIRKFTEAYAEEFDRQCLVADAGPFTGILHARGVKTHTIASRDGGRLTYEDFRKAEMLVPSAERRKCRWFLHDTVLNEITGIKDGNGRPLWREPWERMPGRIDGYECRCCGVLPQFSDLKAGTAFAVFMNPANILHGNRSGIELRRFSGTTEGLEYGQEFLRFRKRDGFLVTLPAAAAVLMTAGGGSD